MNRVLAVIMALVVMILSVPASAEETIMYILCKPSVTNHVCIRRSPRKKAEETGMLDCGDSFYTDGETRNGYIHVIGLTEYDEGWVHAGYVVADPPVIESCWGTIAATGRVRSRNRIDGKQTAWLDVGSDLRVYARSYEWAVTNRGYVKMKYLEVWYEN